MIQGQATIRGLQEAQAANVRMMAQLTPSGTMGVVVRDVLIDLHRYATAITHVDTGALRASHRMILRGLEGEIFIEPGARNPRSGAKTAEYGEAEEARGGSHAFYSRTTNEEGEKALGRARQRLEQAIRW